MALKMSPGCCPCGPAEPPEDPTFPNCDCAATIPGVLLMDSDDESCDGAMFRDCTLRRGATPTVYAPLGLGAEIYLSDESFTDDLGQDYRYYFTCHEDRFTLTRVYATNAFFGSPYRDAVRYAWFVNAVGNSCDPFLLTAGFPTAAAVCAGSFITITPE